MSSCFDLDDAIAATASAPGPGVRGIVRVSGPGAWRIATAGFEPDRPIDESASRPFVVRGTYRLPGLRPGLPAEVALWPAPRTYTGQELAEVHAPGSPPLLSRLLAHVLAIGALRNRLLDLLAHLEAGLDFVDEADVDPIGRAALAADLSREADALDALADRLGRRDRSGDAPRVVLAGPPNAGKSRLFNAMLGDDHAIVSPLAGTTRDTLSAPCACDGVLVELVDTAGVEAAGDAISAEAQARAASEADRADVVLACSSGDSPPIDLPGDERTIRVWTKGDAAPPPPGDGPWIVTSAAASTGLDELKRAVAAAIRRRESEPASPTSARCRDSLLRAAASLRAASGSMAAGAGDELIAFDLRSALDDLAEVTGAVVADDVLDRIFARFCIGK